MPLDPRLEPVLDHLVARAARGQLIPLVGAGASRWAGLPGWSEAICTLAADLVLALRREVPDASRRFRPPPAGERLPIDDLTKIGDACRHLCGEERLVAKLRSLFSTEVIDASRLPLHAVLVRLAGYVPALYTTNFDDLLEKAFTAAGRSFQAVVDAHDLDDWRFDEIDDAYVPRFPIYKLHGSLDRPQTLVLGEADFHRRATLAANPIDLRFCSDVVGRALLLVGYGFNDPNVRWIWTKLRDLSVLPDAYFLELGESTDLDVAYFGKDRVRRVDLKVSDRRHPRELLEFLTRLVERCEQEIAAPPPRAAPPRKAAQLIPPSRR